MGAGSSSMLARSWRHSLAGKLCPSRAKARGQRGRGCRNVEHPLGRTLGHTPSHPPGQPPRRGVVVVPLDNPPDVIEAHERYHVFSYGQPATAASSSEAVAASRGGLCAPQPATSPSAASASPAVRYSGYSSYRPAAPLPTQHHHPADLSLSEAQTASSHPHSPALAAPAIADRDSAPCAAAASRRPHGHSRRRSEGAQSAQSRRGHRGRAAKPAKPARADRPRPRQGLEDAKVVTRTEPARSCFGYDIEDVDGFLAKASPESPANIPMVLASACTLYQTREGGWQDEVPLPLGMVVNGVFRASCWLYAQTPHGHEGYLRYSTCLPLGILPAATAASAACSQDADQVADEAAAPRRRHQDRGLSRGPCWDTASDIFPFRARPVFGALDLGGDASGNRTDTDKMRETRSERAYGRRSASAATGRVRNKSSSGSGSHGGSAGPPWAERSLDALFVRVQEARALALRAHRAIPDLRDSEASREEDSSRKSRAQTLVVVQRDHHGPGLPGLGLRLRRGDEVAVLESGGRGRPAEAGWLLVRDRLGRQGVVPSTVVDSGFL